MAGSQALRTPLCVLVLMIMAGCGGSSGDRPLAGDTAASPDAGGAAGVEVAPPDADESAPAPVRLSRDLRVTLPASGRIALTVHAHERAGLGGTLAVETAIPFPPDVLQQASAIRVMDEHGRELPTRSEALLYWRAATDGAPTSIRAVRLLLHWSPAGNRTETLWLDYGIAPAQALPRGALPGPARLPVAEAEFFPAEYGLSVADEPAVFVTLPADWLGASLLRSRTLPLDAVPATAGFDGVQPAFARTAVNDVRDHVTAENLVDVTGDYEPWLFDRAGTLWNLYLRTGELKWYRHAWRATRFYAAQVASSGYFAMKSFPDLKYSYNQSLLVGYALTGDETLAAPIETVAQAAATDSFQGAWQPTLNFWTERHLAYSTLASLTAWELTGSANYLSRVQAVVSANLRTTDTPGQEWPAIGCVLHTVIQHEGGGTDSHKPACSPWMVGLYAEVLWRLYLVSHDTDALQQLSRFGNFVRDHGSYVSSGVSASLEGRRFPYYLAGPDYDSYRYGVSDEWTDREHSCDVSALAYRTAYAQALLGQDNGALVTVANELFETCLWLLPQWIRTSEETVLAGKTFYRLAPPRKFNWWFGPTSDLSFFRQALVP